MTPTVNQGDTMKTARVDPVTEKELKVCGSISLDYTKPLGALKCDGCGRPVVLERDGGYDYSPACEAEGIDPSRLTF